MKLQISILAFVAELVNNNDQSYLPIQAKYFVDKFAVECKHREIKFVEQNMGINCSKLLSVLIRENNYFTRVNLSKNIIKSEGVRYISNALKRDKRIIHLDLSSNGLSDKGIAYICDMLKVNNCLISLCIKSYEGLNRNKLSSQGLVPLKEVMIRNKVRRLAYFLDFDVPGCLLNADRLDRLQAPF